MKNTVLLLSLVAMISLNAQNYQFLGGYTSNGTPLYLENPGDVVSAETLEMISNSLPESYPVPDYNPHYISSGYDTDVILTQAAEVWVTFISEGAGYRNVLGFYTYDVTSPSSTAPQPEDVTIIFPNASALGSGGGLLVGDKVKIGTFPAGTGIGWVLLANAWSSGSSSVGYGHWQLYSNPDYNPEADPNLRFHNVLLNDPDNERVILGFEDIRRDYSSCDNDFNDAVFYVTANPYEAMATTNYADVDSATDVTSGNNGGLESNGRLANLIAKRNFKRKKTPVKTNDKNFQHIYNKSSYMNRYPNEISLEDYFPDTGMFGTETAYISSPEDLLDITNANAVFSVDYYINDSRVSAALATATEGSIYDHSKVICDRLNGSSLEDIRTVIVRGHQMISSEIKRATNETEYTLSFSVKLGDASNELFSFWNIAQYPEGDYLNFQIWGGSFSQVFTIANYIVDSLNSEKPLTSNVVDDVIPVVFVKSGFYSNGEISLNIINKVNAASITFEASIAETEVSARFNMTEQINLSGAWNDSVSISTGALFDIGFSLNASESIQQDALYLADGPWGIDYLEDYATIAIFDVTNDIVSYSDEIYEVERQPSVSGQVKGNVNLFRHLLPGDQTLNVTDFNSIQFSIINNQSIEIVLMPEDLEDWNSRLRYTIPAQVNETFYQIPFQDFVDGNGVSATINDIKTVAFSVVGDYITYVPFSIEINDLAFANEAALALSDTNLNPEYLSNYPNPFKTETTIKLQKQTTHVNLKVINMLGRIVDEQYIETTSNAKKVNYKTTSLSAGVYKYILVDDSNEKYIGTFLLE